MFSLSFISYSAGVTVADTAEDDHLMRCRLVEWQHHCGAMVQAEWPMSHEMATMRTV